MAGSIIKMPVNGDSDWTSFVTQVEYQRLGFMAMAVSNIGDTGVPIVQAASALEVDGSIYEFGSGDSATGWGDISNSTVAFMKVVPDGDSCALVFTDADPTWSDVKHGWYGDTDDRYFLSLYRGGDTNAFQQKSLIGPFRDSVGDRNVDMPGANASTRLRFATDASILWSEDGDYFDIDKAIWNASAGGLKLKHTAGNVDINIEFASDADILWDESEDEFYFNKSLKVNGGVETDGTKIRTKVIDIGDWDMDDASFVTVAHGLGDWKKTRRISVIIRNDGDDSYYSFGDCLNVIDPQHLVRNIYIDATNVTLTRDADGVFDAATFDTAASYNRGWITITYVG